MVAVPRTCRFLMLASVCLGYFLLTSCGGSSGESGDQLASEQANDQADDPGATVDPSGGDSSVDSDAAPSPPTLPETFKSFGEFDPRTFVPAKDYVPGLEKKTAQMEGAIVTIPDISGFDLPACSHPIILNSRAQLTPNMDGRTDEWELVHLVAADRAGDGFKVGGKSFDLREVYYAEDSTSIYIAAVMNDPWPTSTEFDAPLVIAFAPLAPLNVETSDVIATPARTFYVYGSFVGEYRNQKFVQVNTQAGANFELAISGRSLELRIAKSELAPSLSDNPYAVSFELWDDESAATDFAGTHIVGLSDVYRCLVEMPGRTTKLIAMRRGPNTSDVLSERYFRAAIASMPAVEAALGHRHAYSDTISVTILSNIDAGGRYDTGNAAMFLHSSANIDDTSMSAMDSFTLTAHEFAHGINAGDLNFRDSWMIEGHSEWAFARATAYYYGQAAADHYINSHVPYFREFESENGTINLDNWQYQSAYYSKAATFFHMVSTFVGVEAMDKFMAQIASGQKSIRTSAQLRQAFAKLPGFPSASSATFWNGWFGGEYSSKGAFPFDLIHDQDGDGYAKYREDAMGTSDQNLDSDGDLIADAFEIWLERNPAKEEQLPAGKIFADGLLSDWSIMTPSSIIASTKPLDSSCGTHLRIARSGAYTDGQHLIIGVELSSTASLGIQIQIGINIPDHPIYTMLVSAGSDTASLWKDYTTLVASSPLSTTFSTKTLEYSISLSKLGLVGSLPAGTQIEVNTHDTKNKKNYCHASGKLEAVYIP